MSNIFGKKQVLLATLIVALGVAVYLNYYFSNQSPVIDTGASVSDTSKNMGDAQYVGGSAQSSEPGDKADYFSQARKNREDARAQSLDLIKEMMNDVKASAGKNRGGGCRHRAGKQNRKPYQSQGLCRLRGVH